MSYVKKALLALLVSLPLNAIPGITTVTNNPIKASAVATAALGGALLAQAKMTHKKGTSFGKHLTKLLISAKNNPSKNPLFTATVAAFIAAGGSLTAFVAKDTIATYQAGRRAQNQTIKENKTPADKTLDKKTQDLIEAGKKFNSAETQALINAGKEAQTPQALFSQDFGKRLIETEIQKNTQQKILKNEIKILTKDYIKNEAQIKKLEEELAKLEQTPKSTEEEVLSNHTKLLLDIETDAILKNDLVNQQNKLKHLQKLAFESHNELNTRAEQEAFEKIMSEFETGFEKLATPQAQASRTKKETEREALEEALELEVLELEYTMDYALDALLVEQENEQEDIIKKFREERIVLINKFDDSQHQAFEALNEKKRKQYLAQDEIREAKRLAKEKNQQAIQKRRIQEKDAALRATIEAEEEKEIQRQREREKAEKKESCWQRRRKTRDQIIDKLNRKLGKEYWWLKRLGLNDQDSDDSDREEY